MLLRGIVLFICFAFAVSQQAQQVEDLLNWCIDSKHHKSKPGPEGSLFGQCTPWKNRSCCTSNTTEALHKDSASLYAFVYDHCLEKKPLSEACRRHFIQDHCFYECSPNVGPWVVTETRSWRTERYYKVPLCATDCIAWFEDCKDDYTCTDNWAKNFEWVSKKDCPQGKTCKKNICPSGSTCDTFQNIYKKPENFCEIVWDDSWEYAAYGSPCMRLWFNGSLGNPNDNVALWKATQIISGASFNLGNLFIVVISLFIMVSYL